MRAPQAGHSLWWPLCAALALAPFAGMGWALCLAASLYLLAAALALIGLNAESDALLRLLLRLVGYPALLLALALALLSLLFDVSSRTLPWLLSVWGGASLSLITLVPLAFCPPWRARRVYAEQSLLLLLALALGALLARSPAGLWFPHALWFFPLILLASLRCGVRGVALCGALLLMLLARLDGGAAQSRLALDALLALSFVLSGLLLGLLIELRQRYQQQLGEFQSNVATLVNHCPSLMSFKGLDGRYLLVNRAYATRMGMSAPQMVGMRVSDLFAPEEAARIRAQDDKVLRCLEPRQFEESHTLGGQSYSTLVTKFPLFGADGLPIGIGSVDIDVSESRRQLQAIQEAEEKYRALIEQSLAGIFIYQNGRLAFVNSKLAEMLGRTVSSVSDATLESMLPQAEKPQVTALMQQHFADRLAVQHFATRLARSDGSELDVEIFSRLFDYRGAPASIGCVLDISDRVAADASQKMTAKVFETSTEGILICDAEMRLIAVNLAFSRITGFSGAEAVGKVSRVFSDRQRENYARMISDLHQRGHWRGELLDRRKNGDWYPAELSLSVVRDQQQAVINYVGLFSDITVRKQAQERLNFLANHDPLTRLPNRSFLIASLEERLQQMVGHDQQLAVIFIDLDRFKLINDSFGHQAGDELLRVIAIRLASTVGARGMLARLGGDEFTLLVSDFSQLKQLIDIAEQVLIVLAKPLRLEEHEVFVTGSLGISVYPNDGADARTLLKNADAAMYRAKDSGKNTYQFFAAEMNTQTFERLVMENSMRQALERREFELYFQPQVNAKTRELAGVEVLLRWRHPQWGLIAPGRFIALAEETGLIKSIGHWVLEESCRQLTEWDHAGLNVPRVAVNLSARQFEQQNLVAHVAAALENAALLPNRLELEITESMIMQNPEETIRILNEIKRLGVQLSIDDFGTGYSSLSMLKRFPLDMLKIDRSFVIGLPQDDDSAAIAEAVLAMSRKLGFMVVAEGVEHEGQASFLEQRGCDILQGYFFGKPMPVEHFVAWLGHSTAPRVRLMDLN